MTMRIIKSQGSWLRCKGHCLQTGSHHRTEAHYCSTPGGLEEGHQSVFPVGVPPTKDTVSHAGLDTLGNTSDSWPLSPKSFLESPCPLHHCPLHPWTKLELIIMRFQCAFPLQTPATWERTCSVSFLTDSHHECTDNVWISISLAPASSIVPGTSYGFSKVCRMKE